MKMICNKLSFDFGKHFHEVIKLIEERGVGFNYFACTKEIDDGKLNIGKIKITIHASNNIADLSELLSGSRAVAYKRNPDGKVHSYTTLK